MAGLPRTQSRCERALTRPRSLNSFTRAAVACLVACTALLLVPALAAADPSSLYQGAGPRPGPDILYEPLADAPQLDNAGNWNAAPILVSGSTAYRGGEFLYQDWIYDDSGALGNPVTNDPRTEGNSFSRWRGTYLYPTNTAVYGNNAADLVELRLQPLTTSTAFRLTLNTIKDSSVIGATIAIGGTPGTLHNWPHGANVRSPAQYFLTVHGTTTPGEVVADLRDAVTGLPVGTAPDASLDTTRRQITVTVPHSSWDPGTATWRLAAGVGLWNAGTSVYRVPAPGNPTATQPGGAQLLGSPPALFNVAFRNECQQEDPVPPGTVPARCEPMPNVQNPNAVSAPSWWRENSQAEVLGSGNALTGTADISPFFANIDFNKLANQVNDETDVPPTGPMNRIMASHFEPEQGVSYSESCTTSANSCVGWLRGRLQPYSIYVPSGPQPQDGYGLTLLLHSLGANYNQFTASNNQSQFGERGPGSIVITAAGRGPDGWYYGYAASDTFEMWADAAARYTLDPEWAVISGYSMGGYATYKLGAQFPDLFAKGQPVVGPPGEGVWVPPAPPQPGGQRSNTNRMLASFRNVPFLIWNGTADELVPVASAQAQAAEFGRLGLRYEWDLFETADHFALAINDEYGEAAVFLGTTEVDRNPPHVTYVRNPTMDFPTGQLTADHAYWLSGITLRNGGGTAPLGTVDVLSQGFGVGDPTPSGVTNGAGVLIGGQAPMPYTCESQSWGSSAPAGTCEAGTTAGPATPVKDALDIEATNVSDVTVNARRARVTCDAQKNITSDGPITVHMVDCPAVPTLSVTDVSQGEGDFGQTDMTFTVTLSGNTDDLPVSASYQTADGTASSGSDYDAVSGTLTFAPGETSKTISVPVHGDTTIEDDETFTLELSDVQFASPTALSATGTIVDDDTPGYPRPMGASPLRVSLVPAFAACTAPNRTHGAPLVFPSCNPPAQESGHLTVGTPDANGRTANSVGSVRFAVSPGDPSTSADEADVTLSFNLTDVRTAGDLSDYTGELEASAVVRITDRDNGPGSGAGTVTDFPYTFTVACAPTTDTAVGSTCSAATTADALVPGTIKEGQRSIWQFGQVEVLDGGADGLASTDSGNSPFARQGIFVP